MIGLHFSFPIDHLSSAKEPTKLERKPTRLTVAASDAILSIVHCYAIFLSVFADSIPKLGEVGKILWNHRSSINILLLELIHVCILFL